MSGCFITFEGGEGTGKSTQVRLFAERLEQAGVQVKTTREPGGTPLAERLRNVILSGEAKVAGPAMEAVLFAAARADHINRLIKPAVSAGRWVVSDRFSDSTRVYQAISGVAPELLQEIEREALDGFMPNLTVILDIDTSVAAGRAAARRKGDTPDRFESEGIEFHEKVRQGFLDVAEGEPARCVVVDADGSIDEVADRVFAAVDARLGTWIAQTAAL